MPSSVQLLSLTSHGSPGRHGIVVDGMADTPGFVPRSVTRIAVTIIYLGVPLPTPSSGPPDYIERTTQ